MSIVICNLRVHNESDILWGVDDQRQAEKSSWGQAPWWVWTLIILFPVVFHPWWLAIISIAAFILFVIFILGPPINRNSHSE